MIALKVDVDTFRGTREGVPALMRLLERFDAPASFLFSLGPDHTGRALRRVFRPGFFGKVARTSVVEHYGIRTLLYGTLLPGPDIGRREADTLRSVARAGFETGVHTWDHVRWQDGVTSASADWTRAELRRATERYAEVFGHAPTVHGAAGWQMNDMAYGIEAELGYTVASDTRGHSPFMPIDRHEGRSAARVRGQRVAQLQLDAIGRFVHLPAGGAVQRGALAEDLGITFGGPGQLTPGPVFAGAGHAVLPAHMVPGVHAGLETRARHAAQRVGFAAADVGAGQQSPI